MKTFTGNIEAKSDDKGRIFIPAAYRKAMREMCEESGADATTLIARRDTENDCLIFYPEQVWNSKVASLRDSLNEWDPQDQMLLMQFISDATEMEMDTQGRVKLPANGAQDTTNTWLFVGMLDRFALWKPETFEARRISQHDLAKEIQKRMQH